MSIPLGRGVRTILFWLVALGSASVLALSHARMQATLESTVAAVDNLTQARLLVSDALLTRERLGSRDPTAAPSRPLAAIDRALGLVEDLRTGRSSVLLIEAQPLGGADLATLAEAYADALRSLRSDIATGAFAGADPIAVRVRVAAVETAALALEHRMYDLVRERIAREERRQRVGLAAWVLFVLLAGAAFTAARGARDRAESARREAEGRYAALASHAQAGIVRTDREGRVDEATDWWRAALGAHGDGHDPWWQALAEPERTRVSELWTRQTARRGTFFLDVQATTPAGERCWLASRWVRDEPDERSRGDASWIGTFIDETDRRRMEDELRQSQRLDAVGRLTAGIAHDFNSLLAVVLSNAELLKEGRDVGPQALELVEEVETAARDGRDMVASLLGFSRSAPLDMRPLDASEAVRGVSRLAHRLVPSSVTLDLRVPDHGPLVSGDRRAIQQILLNLVSNAADAMPGGGRLAIEVDAVEIDEAYRDVHPWIGVGRFGRLTVTDEGVGMDEETLKRVFDPFFTTKGEGKGTGLGLSMVHGLVRQQEGYVHAYSEPGAGTTFRVYLPLATDEVQVPDTEAIAATAGADSPEGAPLRVLLVDDDERLRRTARRILVRLGHHVREAGNGQEALEVIDEGDDPVDLVISDVAMPEMDGLELFREVQSRGSGLPFIFTSGYSVQETAGRRRTPEGALYLPKPWTVEELRAALRTASASRGTG